MAFNFQLLNLYRTDSNATFKIVFKVVRCPSSLNYSYQVHVKQEWGTDFVKTHFTVYRKSGPIPSGMRDHRKCSNFEGEKKLKFESGLL